MHITKVYSVSNIIENDLLLFVIFHSKFKVFRKNYSKNKIKFNSKKKIPLAKCDLLNELSTKSFKKKNFENWEFI